MAARAAGRVNTVPPPLRLGFESVAVILGPLDTLAAINDALPEKEYSGARQTSAFGDEQASNDRRGRRLVRTTTRHLGARSPDARLAPAKAVVRLPLADALGPRPTRASRWLRRARLPSARSKCGVGMVWMLASIW